MLLGIGLWQLLGAPASPYFPPPKSWYDAVKPLAENGVLLHAVGWTTFTFLLGLGIAAAVGFLVGVVIGSSRTADRALGPTFEFFRVLPASALVPLAVLLLGFTMQMKLVIVVIPATWPILLTVRAARRSMSPVMLDVPRTLGLGYWEKLWKVILPALARPVLLGIRVAAPLALIITLLVEIITRINGVGALLGNAQSQFKSAQVYGLLVIAGALGFLVNWATTRLEGRVSARMGVGGE